MPDDGSAAPPLSAPPQVQAPAVAQVTPSSGGGGKASILGHWWESELRFDHGQSRFIYIGDAEPNPWIIHPSGGIYHRCSYVAPSVHLARTAVIGPGIWLEGQIQMLRQTRMRGSQDSIGHPNIRLHACSEPLTITDSLIDLPAGCNLDITLLPTPASPAIPQLRFKKVEQLSLQHNNPITPITKDPLDAMLTGLDPENDLKGANLIFSGTREDLIAHLKESSLIHAHRGTSKSPQLRRSAPTNQHGSCGCAVPFAPNSLSR